ncbi:serine hydrolase domain-containing protein [Streptomyces sp. NPDC127098]|uniref:serine hydrolase domain-containing protein n=1 Tax=Streptomyces sp. NPDC127098 TaxID=3347137 RepID=UPI0036488A92
MKRNSGVSGSNRRFGHGAWARAALAVAGIGAIGAASVLGPGAWAQAVPGEYVGGAGRGQLQRDADAVRDTGASGLVVQARDAAGRDREARSGVADLEEGGSVPFDAYYRIGSDTKTFVAVVALQLVAEGTLSLDDTVEEWLPGVVTGNGNDGSRITLRNLLQHTSGLANYTDILFADPAQLTPENYLAQRFTAQTPEEQVALAMTRAPGWLPDARDPGAETRWAYSNTNYVLAGMIIERATGHPWEQEAHERIIEPLDLRHTMTMRTSSYVPQPTATGYLQFPGQEELTDTTLSVGGGADGGIVSTTSDMNTFLRALMDGTLLPAEQLTQMRTTVPADFGSPGAGYGLGIAWRPAEGCDAGVWFHGGTSFGTSSEAAVTPDGEVSAAAAVFTTRLGDQERFLEQAEATVAMIDRAVCG